MSRASTITTWCCRLACGIVLGAVLWSAAVPTATAQQTQTLQIRNGTVSINGQVLSDEQLPEGLNLDGVNAQYRFLGIRRPVIELNGQLFAVEDNLTPITREELQAQRSSAILQGDAVRNPPAQQQAGRAEADQRDYLDAVQRSSRELYQRLVRERRMERQARELAHTIRRMPEGAERRSKIDTLRTMLGQIFELKQENRRREIERLEQQIEEIQQSIEKRAQIRSLMIERRLQQLIESSDER